LLAEEGPFHHGSGFDLACRGDLEPTDRESRTGIDNRAARSVEGNRPKIPGAKRPANARSGRSALVIIPGGAETTDRIALRAGIPVIVMPTDAKASGEEKSVPGFGKIMCLE